MSDTNSGCLRKSTLSLATIAAIFGTAIVLLILLISFSWLEIRWPWEDLDVVQQESDVAVDVEQGPAQIIDIKPLSLDCRARISAEVPVVGQQKTTLAGQTISTDTVRMRAIGDVDTCVDPNGVRVLTRDDGTIGVVIEASAIRFERPRVDAVATMGSVSTDRGIINQLVEALPLTNEDDELTPAAFAFAQTVIGGSDCMQAAYEQTQTAVANAYREQLVDQGGNPDDIDVVFSGAPDFTQNDQDATALGAFEFVEEPGTSCIVSQ